MGLIKIRAATYEPKGKNKKAMLRGKIHTHRDLTILYFYCSTLIELCAMGLVVVGLISFSALGLGFGFLDLAWVGCQIMLGSNISQVD